MLIITFGHVSYMEGTMPPGYRASPLIPNYTDNESIIGTFYPIHSNNIESRTTLAVVLPVLSGLEVTEPLTPTLLHGPALHIQPTMTERSFHSPHVICTSSNAQTRVCHIHAAL